MITGFEKISVGGWNSRGVSVSKLQDDNTEYTFADALKSEKPSTVKVPCAPPDVDPDVEITERWGSEEQWGYVFVLKNTLDYLSELGVDTTKRTPTHTITNEQREWLASRHDLEALGNSSGTDTPEKAELFGDLVFLGVLSATEVCQIMVPLPPIPEGKNH